MRLQEGVGKGLRPEHTPAVIVGMCKQELFAGVNKARLCCHAGKNCVTWEAKSQLCCLAPEIGED